MTKSEIEAKIAKLKGEMLTIEGAFDLICEYAFGEGTGSKAIAHAVSKIESQIAEAEKELAALPKPSPLEIARRTYEYCGATNASTKDYIAALEKCRPWVIRIKGDSMLWKYEGTDGKSHVAMFGNKSEADSYVSGRHGGNWEVVQWEGEQ